MRVVFRCDAALHIGTGHVMRCLTLATMLREQGARCMFICRKHSGHLLEYINKKGFTAFALTNIDSPLTGPKNDTKDYTSWLGAEWQCDAQQTISYLGGTIPDWLIVDHYSLDFRWETQLRPYVRKILVIDDLANRRHDCDLLLDQNFGRHEKDYRKLVPDRCNILTGSSYALLRPEFHQWRTSSLQRRINSGLSSLLITMGGIDKDNATGKVLETIKECALPQYCRIQVVMGATAPWLTEVKCLAATMPWPTEVAVDINTMAQCMAQADLAIGAAGSTSWERCCLGLPTLMLILADNQRSIAEALHKAQAAVLIGELQELEQHLPIALKTLNNKLTLLNFSTRASSITDGLGCARIAEKMGETHD